jgi:hypothetical protein
MVKARSFIWVKPVAHIREKKSEDSVLLGKPLRKNHSEY